ncbi:MAG TPA: hypothetical protein VN893_10585 [Bryobacteraceae bacterium]|nr:hypothetical protein [Bryobacteraceae bacterium]
MRPGVRTGPVGVASGAPKNRKLILEELERVRASHEFGGSERSCALLQYLVERALDGGEHLLKERTIGVEVFGRESAYDTGKDAIVRVSVNGVRKRLLAHYANPNLVREPGSIQIFLPVGSYLVEFHPPGEPPARPSPQAPSPAWWRRWPVSAWAAVAVLALACAVSVGYNRRLAGRVPSSPVMELLPWTQFGSQKIVRVGLTDANYTIYTNTIVNRPLTLDEYLGEQWTGNFPPDMAGVSPRSGNQYTSLVSAVAASRVSAMLETTGRTALLVPARQLQMEYFKGEQPVILLGSVTANPWAELFRESLTFAIEMEPTTRLQYMSNRAPLAGEPSRWEPTPRTISGTAYAILSLIPNLTGKSCVLLVAGTSSAGTAAAAELLTDSARLRHELLARGIDPAGRVQRLELLLRVQFRNTDSRSYEVIASRVVRD